MRCKKCTIRVKYHPECFEQFGLCSRCTVVMYPKFYKRNIVKREMNRIKRT